MFALARTGPLDGRSATAHWARVGQLRREFPEVRVEPGMAYVDHGDVATSAGAGAGLDLFPHLVRQDHGAAHAALVARHMVMPPHRDGGQARYGPSAPPADALDGLLEWADARLGTPLSMGDLAAHLNVSPRTLAWRFAEAARHEPRRVASVSPGGAGSRPARGDRPAGGGDCRPRWSQLGGQPAPPLPYPGGHDPGRLPAGVPGLLMHADPKRD